MQNQNLKFTTFLILLFFGLFFSGKSKDLHTQKQTADSLFAQQKFLEAQKQYDSLYWQMGISSPAMLLKMAYISEGLHHTPEALYYLTQYSYRHPSSRLTEKIQSMASAEKISGYDELSPGRYLHFLHLYEMPLLIGLCLLAALFTSLFFWKKQKGWLVGTLCTIATIAILNNLTWPQYGIVWEGKTLLMEAPSSGSKVIATLPKGERIMLFGHKDVWRKAEAGNKKGYLKSSQIQPL